MLVVLRFLEGVLGFLGVVLSVVQREQTDKIQKVSLRVKVSHVVSTMCVCCFNS